MRIRQPGVQRRQSDLGAVAKQQEHEGDIEQRRIEGVRALDQDGPDHGVDTFADDRPRRHVNQNGAEQRERDADAAENEIFPGRFQRLVRAVDADHENGGERRHFDRHPHQADIVGDQRQVHGEHQHLIHGVIKAHERRRQAPDLELMADIARAENAGREADEGGQHDEGGVEIVDQQIEAGFRPAEEQRQRAEQRQPGRCDIDPRRDAIAREHCEQRGGNGRNHQHAGERIDESSAFSAVTVERLHVDRVETLADAEQEDSDHDEAR